MRRQLRLTLDAMEERSLLSTMPFHPVVAPPFRHPFPTPISVAPIRHPFPTPISVAPPRTATPVMTPPRITPAPGPIGTTNAPSVATSIFATLTTDKSSYKAGENVKMSLTETNTSSQAVTIYYGPSRDGFSVTQNGATVWKSNAGMQPMFIRAITLQPGQSYTFTSVWNDVSNATPRGNPTGGPLTGTFQVNANFEGVTAAPVTITVS